MYISVGYRPSCLDDANAALFFWQTKVKSLSAKADRTDPNEDTDFGDTVSELIEAYEEISRLSGLIEQLFNRGY